MFVFEYFAAAALWAGLWFIIPAIVVAIFLERADSPKWAITLTLIASAAAAVIYDVSLTQYSIFAGIYLVCGFLWSFVRWGRFTKYEAERQRRELEQNIKSYATGAPGYTEDDLRAKARQRLIQTLTATYQWGRITQWVFIWPVSFINHFAGDLIDMVQGTIKAIAGQTYNRISAKAIADFDKT